MDRDAPLLLETAARLAFPDGAVTARGLRREAARGRLAIWKIAGRLFTSLAEIERMRSSCRVTQNLPGSGSASAKAAKRSGLSSTEADSIELAALLATAEGLGEDVIIHTLRHTFASHAVMNGVSFGEVAEAIGTTEAIVKRVYGHLAQGYTRATVEAVARGRR